MNHLSVNCGFRPRAWVAALSLVLLTMGAAATADATEQAAGQTAVSVSASAPASMPGAGMAHMAGHMYMTTLRPIKEGNRQKADVLVQSAKAAMAPYQDYHKALSDGYEIFLPNVPQPQYHFTKYQYGLAARSSFDPGKPTSLLYTKTADGGYKLVGAM